MRKRSLLRRRVADAIVRDVREEAPVEGLVAELSRRRERRGWTSEAFSEGGRPEGGGGAVLSAGEGEGSPFGRRSFEGYAERLERVVVAVEEAPRRLVGVPKEGGEGDARALEGEALVVRDAAPEEEAEDGVRVDGGGERGGVGAVPERRVAAARAHRLRVAAPRLDVREERREVVHRAHASERLAEHVREVQGEGGEGVVVRVRVRGGRGGGSIVGFRAAAKVVHDVVARPVVVNVVVVVVVDLAQERGDGLGGVEGSRRVRAERARAGVEEGVEVARGGFLEPVRARALVREEARQRAALAGAEERVRPRERGGRVERVQIVRVGGVEVARQGAQGDPVRRRSESARHDARRRWERRPRARGARRARGWPRTAIDS